MNRLIPILTAIAFLLFYALGYYMGQSANTNTVQREFFYRGLAVFCLRAPSPTEQDKRVYTVDQCESLYEQAVDLNWYEQSLFAPFMATATP
jgi:hypothetical protein